MKCSTFILLCYFQYSYIVSRFVPSINKFNFIADFQSTIYSFVRLVLAEMYSVTITNNGVLIRQGSLEFWDVNRITNCPHFIWQTYYNSHESNNNLTTLIYDHRIFIFMPFWRFVVCYYTHVRFHTLLMEG